MTGLTNLIHGFESDGCSTDFLFCAALPGTAHIPNLESVKNLSSPEFQDLLC